MRQKNILWVALFCGIIFAQGCSTTKGVGQDTTTFVDKIRQADAWVTEHLW